MQNFLGAFLCFFVFGFANAQAPVKPEIPPAIAKYHSLPYPPFSRFQIKPISKMMYDEAWKTQADLFKPLDSNYQCPKTNKIIKRVYDRIVKANDLDRFFWLNGITMNLIVHCPVGGSDNAYAATGLLRISAPFVRKTMKSEDELAFVLSHELSHVLQASDYKFMMNRLTYNFSHSVTEEEHADENGLVMASSAGYDAHSAYAFEQKYVETLSAEEATQGRTHTAPMLRPVNFRLFISRHRLPKRSPTNFSFDDARSFAEEVGQF